MRKLLFQISLIFLISTSAVGEINPKDGCKSNQAVVDKCFTVHGRISVCNGTPAVRLWPIGTKRLIGILPSENEIMPKSIKNNLKADIVIYGEYLICPFTKAKSGQMQFACIESASNFVIKKARRPK